MVALYSGLHEFFLALAVIELIGLLIALQVPVPETVTTRRRIYWRTLVLVRALIPAVALMFASVPYGMTTSYITLLADEYGLTQGAGAFYACMACGLGFSRVIGGKWVDRWNIPIIIIGSFASVIAGYLLLLAGKTIPVFLLSAFVIGLSFGVVHSAFNTLFIRIGGNGMRVGRKAQKIMQ